MFAVVGMLVRRLAASETFQLLFKNDSDTFRVFQRRRDGCFASLRFASSSRSSSVRAAIVYGDSSIESVRVVM